MKKYKGIFIANLILSILSTIFVAISSLMYLVHFAVNGTSSDNNEDFIKSLSLLGVGYFLVLGFGSFLGFITFILNIVCGALLVSKPGYSGVGILILVGAFLLPLLAFIGVCIGLAKISKDDQNNQLNQSNLNSYNQNNYNSYNQNDQNNFNQGL
ncbi:hypothetical protein AB5V95_02415 [Metamycoplasma spumans]|uniref:hypothetical protein n=1 Tax=Metamycoplasma spumans TaxID=92406 RepID=UPI0034DD6B91